MKHTSNRGRCTYRGTHATVTSRMSWPIVEDLIKAADWFPSLATMATFCLLLGVETTWDAESEALGVLADVIANTGECPELDLARSAEILETLRSDGRLSQLRGWFYDDRDQLMRTFAEFNLVNP
ncbi:MAG: hypothetical protein U0S36_04575 [Candidatus Nanopelagicales bacterium]